jgi:hypothetical protein
MTAAIAFLVVESMDSGRLYRYGFAVSGNEATFTLSGEVAEQYTPVRPALVGGHRSPCGLRARSRGP